MIDPWTLGALALGAAAAMPAAKRRIELSLAKHPSLAGHARMASRVARLVPGYAYGEERFFGVDEAPPEVQQRRRAGFERLAAALAARHERTLALTRSVRGSIPDLQFTAAYRVPYPFSAHVRERLGIGAFLARSDGVRFADLDGRTFFDLTGSYGVNLLGSDFYKSCIAEGSARVAALGPVLGSYHPCVASNVERLCELSGQDEVSFHMSGTEAVMQAVRVARYHTGRTRVVRFTGAYHGWWDDVQPGPGNPTPPGHTYTLKEMDEDTLRVLRTRRDIACVLINPLQALHPNRAAPGDGTLVSERRSVPAGRAAYARWLQSLREVCSARGIALIFDEVFMGFRLAPGGAQQYFGVRADLVAYGKTLGGGLPVGVVCGASRWMRRFRDERPADICFARGTFNAHPYVMGAMQVFLERLQDASVLALYEGMDERWDSRAAQLNARLQAESMPLRLVNLGTVWTVDHTLPSRYNWLLQFYLREQGLALSWVGTGRLIFSLDYGAAEFDAVCDRFMAAARSMREDGWWWVAPSQSKGSIGRQLLLEMLRARR